jgi:glycosyltransferase involved in cell wall biosynthesis
VPARLTFAIPFYRDVEYLARALASVQAQTAGDWEALVADDAGPSPGAAAVVEALGDARFRYVRNERNLGLAGNWNHCLALASTDLVTLLHADDELRPGYAAAVLAAHERHPGAAAVFCATEIIGADSERAFSFPDAVKQAARRHGHQDHVVVGDAGLASILRVNHIFCPTLCYRRSVVGAAPFSSEWRMVLDLALVSRLLLDGHRLVGIPDVEYAYRRHGASETVKLTTNADRFREEIAVYDRIAAEAAARGWRRAETAARRKRIVRLHLVDRALGDATRGRFGAAKDKLRLALES